jgi:ureidoacrylate peracid hydrolase
MNLAAPPQQDAALKAAAERLTPGQTALLVIDMQNDFCAEGGYIESVVGKNAAACRAAAEPIATLVATARTAGVPVYWVRADYRLEKLPAGMAARFAAQGKGRVCCEPDSWGAAFYHCAPAPGESVVTKHCYSGFIGTDLEARLRARGARTLVFAGVQTNVCVETTLRDAYSLGFNVVVAADCVASHTAELHEATLKNVRFLFGDVLSGREIAALWPARA